MKLVRPEAHSIDLSSWLRDRLDIGVLSSVLIEVELMRATRRSAPDRLGRALDVLLGIGVVTVSPAVIARAAAYADPELRSLDSIHLATAEHLLTVTREPLQAFVAYDERLLGAARGRGLAVAAPGAI
jgi:predicted nucleic acid-binding protein